MFEINYSDDIASFLYEYEISRVVRFHWANCRLGSIEVATQIQTQQNKFSCFLPVQNAIITGDFNADCTYLNKGERSESLLFKDTRFTQLFGEDVDTNLASSHCAYDRYVKEAL